MRRPVRMALVTPPGSFWLFGAVGFARSQSATSRVTVGDYVEAEAQLDPDFPERLKAGFLEEYYARRKEGHKGDELFELMCAFAQ